MRFLKYIRRVVAFIVLLLFLLIFIDFTGLIPVEVNILARIQFIPALISHSWFIVLGFILSVLVLGRVYCSILCPLGIMKDLISLLRRRIDKLRGNKKRRLFFNKANSLVRNILMAISFLPLWLLGSSFFLLLLDPYSNFGRIASSIFRPIYMWLNNLLAIVANLLGNYSLYRITPNIDIPSFIFVILLFMTIIILAWRKERYWCNTICPVGTLFGLFSRYSLFQIKLDGSKCISCNKCSNICKSHCIDPINKQLDGSRCVSCYNCLSICDKGAMKYDFSFSYFSSREEIPKYRFDKSRKHFIFTSLAMLTTIPFIGIASSINKALLLRTTYPIPPGATSDFSNRCTGCHLCISQCPMGVLRPAFNERGLSGFMQPIMYFKPHRYCNYECTICTEVCPTGALQPLRVEQKKLCQVGYVCFVVSECVVETLGQDCGACAEHCPTGAVKMIPYKNGNTIPHIEPDICIGCGACESICPVRPKAIFIEGNKVQKEAKKPYIQEIEKVVVDDFGF